MSSTVLGLALLERFVTFTAMDKLLDMSKEQLAALVLAQRNVVAGEGNVFEQKDAELTQRDCAIEQKDALLAELSEKNAKGHSDERGKKRRGRRQGEAVKDEHPLPSGMKELPVGPEADIPLSPKTLPNHCEQGNQTC